MSTDTPTADPLAGAGLPLGTGAPSTDDAADRSLNDVKDAAATGQPLKPREASELLTHYLTNAALPGDDDQVPVDVVIGYGTTAQDYRFKLRPITWDVYQTCREKAVDEKTGVFNAYTLSSWVVAQALVEPQLAPAVLQLRGQDGAPTNGPELLQRMFQKQAGTLLELGGKVNEISKMQNDNGSVREVEAGKA